MTSVVDARQATATRFVCRSYWAVVLAPKSPIVEWIAEINQRMKDSEESFLGNSPVVVDLNAVKLSKLAIVHLITELEQRGIRVLGLENVDAFSAGAGLPPLLRSSHSGTVMPDRPAPPAHDVRKEPSTLLLDKPIRSGQSIFFPDGDVTVLGSVASGAELVAGGSIDVYGTCADALWQDLTAIHGRASSATRSRRSSWQSVDTILPPSQSISSQRDPCKHGSMAMR